MKASDSRWIYSVYVKANTLRQFRENPRQGNRHYCIKSVPYTINSHALTGEKPCINKGFHGMLMHRKLPFNMIVPGPLILFRHTLYLSQYNKLVVFFLCFYNRPIKLGPLKKMLGPGLESCFPG